MKNEPDFAAAVRSGYDRWAAVYDHDGNPLQALEEPALRVRLGDVRGQAVLDLGCGTGRHALWLAAQGAQVTALDFSPGMLEQARAKPGAGAVRFLCHDLRLALPLADDSFDQVVSGLVLEHLEDLPAVFREVARVLRPAGRVLASAMHPAMFERGAHARFTDPATGEIVAPGSLRHSLADFRQAAEAGGLEVLELLEASPDAVFARCWPRAERYIGWPMLALLVCGKPA
ncbi:MAG: class I SAM-dependent methyltransferase [Candidatus Delongbacteria bacterium]